ncbi:zinc finger and SCAN domain-containing protein 12-like [Ochlerotatus camptorhynchus]|uniref:zinc finger and SCAN domain-containing protein 12-like n=1 Tax=Ochlerotatus camptorhynchus TaxID=644619 RepID=UPI0031D9FEB3
MDRSINRLECRVCESEELLINIFMNEVHRIVEKLCFCASVQVSENDGLPQHICTKCFADLEIAYAFRKRCEENDAKLRIPLNVPVKVEIFEFLASDIETVEELEEVNYPCDNEINTSENAISKPDVELGHFEEQDSVSCDTSDLGDADSLDELQPSIQKISKTYTCDTCGTVFSIRSDYHDHIRAHGTKRFQCKTCLKWFSRKPVLIRHELRHLGKQKRVPCDRCSLDFNCRAALVRHIAGVHDKRRDFVCTICGHGFSQKTGLQAHQSVHSGSQFRCSICHATFKSLRYYLRHEQSHLPPEKRDPKLMFTTTSYNSYKQQKRIYVCSYCGKTSNTLNGHIIHERFHRDERPYPCKTCGKAFRRNVLLKKHMRTHTGERPYKCEICGKCFREKSHLTTHNLTHTQERKHVCQICSKAFALKCTLKSHLKCHAVCDENESIQ